jgi:ribosome production factor 2
MPKVTAPEDCPKTSVVLRGNKSSPAVTACLHDFHRLRSPLSLLLSRKHSKVYPFEQFETIQRVLHKHKCNLFCLGTHSKKRPNNIVLGRTYDDVLLDMFELALIDYRGLKDFPANSTHAGFKPVVLFQGELFETEEKYLRLKSLLLDFFGGEPTPKVDSRSLDRALVFSITEDESILMQQFQVRIPFSTTEIGPRAEFKLRRMELADDKKFRAACKLAKKPKKVKNVTTTPLREKRGRVHIQQQDIKTIALKKRKLSKPETA